MSSPTVETDAAAFRSVAAEAPVGARVPVEVRVAVSDPFDAYRRARDGPGGAFLETTGGQSGWGYFGVEPVERLTVGPDAVLRRPSEPPAEDALAGLGGRTAPSLAALQGLLDGEALIRGDCDVPYPCGAIGWLSYDVVREIEDLPESADDDRGLPQIQVGVFDRLAAWEEPRDGETTLRITACPRIEGDGEAAIDAAYERGRERALDLARRAVEGNPEIGEPPVERDRASFESDCGREAFAERVRRVKEYVREGDTFQANVSQRLTAPAAVHPVAAYDAVREVNPAPYSGLLEFPGVDLVSASPELLLDRDGDRIETEPIAGTRPRGATDADDEALEDELLDDDKERAEHAMLVDLERNDLGKVSAYGSVDVPEYRRIDRYSEVMHLVSRVTGELRPGAELADAIAAVFPGGTITGAPKPRTMEIIEEVEATRRGPYTGSMAIFGFDERATLNIVIRTLVRQDAEYHLRVGAGIVHDSVPEREYEETLDKARALVRAVDEALDDRTSLGVEGGGVDRTDADDHGGEPR
ncbi:aminodeoxychorismate synthase, subunit I [Natronoarchaeum philippinense]|uniref:anthranilate synthase n=1 Tax=Natronoarchaeum philippinense TaxID=558529 RepID=A0A285PBW4_NATPI|nr:aminodeoxychorismate synthase, component I [Natronoarchaeum philippinense]SNZ17351.1 aminodeoxychorismate synthase, subunit I [Natronoarchaeum philippinense]